MAWSRLLKVGSMSDSLRIYVPAMILQKSLGLGRMLVFLYLLRDAIDQYNLWNLGAMIFTMASPILSLGAGHGLARYVSVYESLGRLREFYRRVIPPLTLLAVALAAAALAAYAPLTQWVIAPAGQQGISADQVRICLLALANAMLLAMYNNLISFMFGLRAYRLASVIEMLFTVAFTALSIAALCVWSSGAAALVAHLAAVAIALATGHALLHKAIAAVERAGSPTAAEPVAQRAAFDMAGAEMESSLRAPADVAPVALRSESSGSPLRQVVRFGAAALIGTLCWMGAGYVSYYLTNRYVSPEAAGRFGAWMQLGQMVVFIAGAAWSVIFSHVAKHWADGRRQEAMVYLESLFLGLTLFTMTLGVAVYATSPFWVNLLPASWRAGAELLGGLTMFFQTASLLTLVTTLARLHERPIIVALVSLAGGATIAVLALWQIPHQAAVGAAWAAGVGMLAGGGVAGILYMLLCRPGFGPGSYLLMASPLVYLLSPGMSAVAWLLLFVFIAVTPSLFQPDRKRMLRSGLGQLLRR